VKSARWLLDGKAVATGLHAFVIAPRAGTHRLTLSVATEEGKADQTIGFTTVRVPDERGEDRKGDLREGDPQRRSRDIRRTEVPYHPAGRLTKEALEVADRVVVMHEGEVQQIGTPEEVYHHPANPFVYNFLGNVNLFHGRVEGGKAYIGSMAMDLPVPAVAAGTPASLYVRPHQVDVHLDAHGPGSFPARVEHINAAGPVVRVELASEWGGTVEAEMSQERYRALSLIRGAQVFVTMRATDVFVDARRIAGSLDASGPSE
jgi:hypothetical protein